MDPIVLIFLAVIAVVGGVTFVVVRKQQQKTDSGSAEALSRRIAILQEDFGDQGLMEHRASKENLVEAVNSDLLGFIGSFTPIPSPEKMEQFTKAGLRSKDVPASIFFQQISGAIMGIVIGIILCFTPIGMAGLALSLCFAYLGYQAPISDIRKRIKERSYRIDKTLPDMIDLFANCCVAGVSFDIAAGYILNDLGDDPAMGAIKEDFLAWQADVNLGMERADSWKRLANRSESKNIRYFTSLINQSEKTGGSVAEALFKMSGFFRERRKQLIESEIATLPTKMSSQTIVFIVMPIVVLLLFPVGLNAFKMMTELFGGR